MIKHSSIHWHLDPQNECLWNGANFITLKPKAFKVLFYFVSNRHRLLTKEEILSAVWGDISVTEGLVKDYVADLRKILNDDAKKPIYIETIHGRGYRLIGNISLTKEDHGRQSPAMVIEEATTARLTVGPLIAVLPIEYPGSNQRCKLIAESICDDIIADLIKFPDLNLLARNTSLNHNSEPISQQQRSIDQGANYIVSIKVQDEGSNLRVRSKLTDVDQYLDISAEHYDVDTSLFSTHDKVVDQTSVLLGGFNGAILTSERKKIRHSCTHDLSSFDLYLLAYECENQLDRESNEQGIKYIQRSLELDPHFSRAWTILGSLCNDAVAGQITNCPDSTTARARHAIFRAVELDPSDPLAIIECGAVYARDGNIDYARKCFTHLHELNINDSDAIVLLAKYTAFVLGNLDEATAMLERAFDRAWFVPEWYFLHRLRIAYFNHAFSEAVVAAKYSLHDMETGLFTILALAQLGDNQTVSSLLPTFKQRYPYFQSESFMKTVPLIFDEQKAHFRDGIAKANLDSR